MTWRSGDRGQRCHVLTSEECVWSTLLASGFGGLGHKTTGGRFLGLGLKTRAEVPRRNGAARGGITEVALRRSKSVQEAWPSDRQKIELDHNALGLGGSLYVSRGSLGTV